MSKDSADIHKISKVCDNIYLSGIYPLEQNPELIKKLNIKYILSCVKRTGIEDIHDRLIRCNPLLTILYIPLNDDINQNLWEKNDNKINIYKYYIKSSDFENVKYLTDLYQGKSMIEIAYNFINLAATNNENILIHCMAGVSRSVSMIIYYFMKKYNLSFDYSLVLIKNTRSIANPNESFKLQLKTYQIKKQYFCQTDADNIIKFIKLNRYY